MAAATWVMLMIAQPGANPPGSAEISQNLRKRSATYDMTGGNRGDETSQGRLKVRQINASQRVPCPFHLACHGPMSAYG